MRTILHSDLNNFYASVELLKRPELAGKPVAVLGSKEDRHGIVLAKNELAKSLGIKTGDVYWEAKKKAPDLVEIPADFSSYLRVSKEVRRIYERYTDTVEPFGIDECWLDVTASVHKFGSGRAIAEEIRNAVKAEIGITVSVGVSFNKIFAKLASDLKKPDAVTEITEKNYKTVVWKLPVENLLYVGGATKKKLNLMGIYTIGDLACADKKFLQNRLGKWGGYLWEFACGKDISPVVSRANEHEIKSIGNSLTYYRDLKDDDDVFMLILLLSDVVASRLRDSAFGKARTVFLSVTDNKLERFGKQGKLLPPTKNSLEIANAAFALFKSIYTWSNPVRAVGVSLKDFTDGVDQLDLFSEGGGEKKGDRVEEAVDKIRKKYGNVSIRRATILQDERLKTLDVKGDHLVHPDSAAAQASLSEVVSDESDEGGEEEK